MLMVPVVSVLVGSGAAFYPDEVLDTTLYLFWALVLVLALYHFGRYSHHEMWLKRIMVAGLFIRLPIILIHLAVGFWVYGGQLDFPGYTTSVVTRGKQILEGNTESAFEILDLSSPSSGRNVASGLLTFSYFLVGSSLPGMLFVSGVIGFLGSYLFLRGFQVQIPSSRETRFLAISLFLFPSLVFWGSLFGKDCLMIFFLGLVTYSIAQLWKTLAPRYVLGVIGGVVFITLMRPPVGIALTLAIGVSLVSVLHRRAAPMLRPVVYAVAALSIVGAITVVSLPMRHYATFSEDVSVADNLLALAVFKHIGLSGDPTAGGSSLPVQIGEASAAEAVRFLPGAIFTFLFRPLVFEAHNVVALVAALDSTLLLILVLWRWRHLLGAIRTGLGSPFLVFCALTFVLLTTGLAFEPNFGVIVRHRIMVLPFLFILLAVPLVKRNSADSRVEARKGGRDLVVDNMHVG